MKLDKFTRAYIEAALWSTSCDAPEGGQGQLHEFYSAEDIASETLKQIQEDCEAFQRDNAQDLETVAEWCDDSRAGQNFWLNRNGHGSGFWDEYNGKDETLRAAFTRLSDASKSCGTYDLYVGDDGQIYGS